MGEYVNSQGAEILNTKEGEPRFGHRLSTWAGQLLRPQRRQTHMGWGVLCGGTVCSSQGRGAFLHHTHPARENSDSQLYGHRERGARRQVWLGSETPGWFLRAIWIHSFHLWLLSWPMLTSQVTQHVQTSSNGSESSWAKREPTLAGREEQAANVRTQG